MRTRDIEAACRRHSIPISRDLVSTLSKVFRGVAMPGVEVFLDTVKSLSFTINPRNKRTMEEKHYSIRKDSIDIKHLAGLGIVVNESITIKPGHVLVDSVMMIDILSAGYVIVSEKAGMYMGVVDVEIARSTASSSATAAPPPQPVKQAPQITFKSNKGCNNSTAAIIKQIIMPIVNCDIVVHNDYVGSPYPESKSDHDRFHIYLATTPSQVQNAVWKTPSTIYGLQPVYKEPLRFAAATDGYPIMDTSGYEIGSYRNNHLYIYPHLEYAGLSDQEKTIFRKILESAAILMTTKDINKTLQEQSRAAYIALCSARSKTAVAVALDEQKRLKADIASTQKTLMELIQRRREANIKIASFSDDDTELVKKLGQEYDKILAMPKIKSLICSESEIKILTEKLYCDHPKTGRRHEIGAFQIVLKPKEGKILWFNQDRRIKGSDKYPAMNAPHVYQDGHACLGNADQYIPELIAANEYAQAFMMGIAFIESVNIDDGIGKFIDLWPLAQEQQNETKSETTVAYAASSR